MQCEALGFPIFRIVPREKGKQQQLRGICKVIASSLGLRGIGAQLVHTGSN